MHKKISFNGMDGIAIVLILFPVLLCCYSVLTFGINVLYMDEWGISGLIQKYYEGTLTFQDFFMQHNEHRIVFPRIILLLTAVVSDYNTKFQMLFIVTMLLIEFILYFMFYKKQIVGNSNFGYLAFFPVAWLIFALRQYENLLWGFQVGFVSVVLFATISFYTYYRYETNQKISCLILTLGFGILASFSSAQGLLVWVAFGVVIIVYYLVEKKCLLGSRWIVLMGVLCWVGYFFNYSSPSNQPALMGNGIGEMIKYFFVLIGNSIFISWNKYVVPICIGIVIIVLAVYSLVLVIKRYDDKSNIFPGLVTIFGFLVALSIAAGRSGYGIQSAVHPRYATFTVLIVTGIYLIIANNVKFTHVSIWVLRSCAISIFVFLLFTNVVCYQYMEIEHSRRGFMAHILSYIDDFPLEYRQRLYPWSNEEESEKMVSSIRDKQLNVYATKGTNQPPENEIIDGGVQFGFDENCIKVVEKKYLLLENAWAVSNSNNDIKETYMYLNNQSYKAFYGIERPDIANYFKDSKYDFSGIGASLNITELTEEYNRIYLVAVLDNGNICRSDEIVFLRNSDDEIIINSESNYKEFFLSEKVNNLGVVEKSDFECNLDYIGEAPTCPGFVQISGWAKLEGASSDNQKIYIEIEAESGAKTTYVAKQTARLDVSQYFGSSDYDNCGFEFLFAPEDSRSIISEGSLIKLILQSENQYYSKAIAPESFLDFWETPDEKTPIVEEMEYMLDGEVAGYIDILENDGLENEILIMTGWSFKEGINTSNQKVYIEVQDGHGNTTFYNTKQQERPDVGAYFGDEKYNFAGYSANIDMSEMQEGTIKLRVVIEQDGQCWASTYQAEYLVDR